MLVRKIAGNALANPATKGWPICAKINAVPIAIAAASPLIDRIKRGTLLSPLGDGLVLILKNIETENKQNNPNKPSIGELMPLVWLKLATFNANNANNAQVKIELMVVIISGFL